jgi:hypothetical protein
VNLREVIISSATINEDLVLYAKRVDGKLLPTSEAVLLELTEEENEMKTNEIAAKRCPGFSYCMEMFLIQEMMQDLNSMEDIDAKVDRMIYYIENDA